MPFRFDDSRTEALIRVLRDHPDGATLIQIAARLDPPPLQRTLQRWLSKLVSVGLVTRRGYTNKLRYFAGSGRGAWNVKKRKPKPPVPDKPKVQTPPPEPAPTPVADRWVMRAEFRSVFDKAAPKIIRMGYLDDVAMQVLGEASVAAFGGDDIDFTNEFIGEGMAQLDALQRDRTIAKYALKPTAWDDWRPEWCHLRDLPQE